MYGGSFISGFKNVFNKAQKLRPYAKQAIKLGKELAPVVNTIAPRAGPAWSKGIDFADELLGEGYTKKELVFMKKAGYKKRDFRELLEGGNLVAGTLLPKDRLRRRLR